MAIRKYETLKNEKGDTAIVFFDSTYGEFVVRFHMAGIGYVKAADYFTDCPIDAIGTAKSQLGVK